MIHQLSRMHVLFQSDSSLLMFRIYHPPNFFFPVGRILRIIHCSAGVRNSLTNHLLAKKLQAAFYIVIADHLYSLFLSQFRRKCHLHMYHQIDFKRFARKPEASDKSISYTKTTMVYHIPDASALFRLAKLMRKRIPECCRVIGTGEIYRVFKRAHHHRFFIIRIIHAAKLRRKFSMHIAAGKMGMKNDMRALTGCPSHCFRITKPFMTNRNTKLQTVILQKSSLPFPAVQILSSDGSS